MTALEHQPRTPMPTTEPAAWQPATAAPTADAARLAMETYQDISRALIDPRDDMQEIRTRRGVNSFPKRSAFQKLANAYRVSTEIISRELTHDDGQLIRCDVIVRATHPDGRYSEGDGACSSTEERFKGNRDKIDHDLPATAVTRAKNRAISDLVAFGAVSAEEAESDGGEPVKAGELPDWARPVGDIGGVAESLVRLLRAVGVENPAEHAMTIGEKTFERCGSTVPIGVWQAINDIADEIDRVDAGPTVAEGGIDANSDGEAAPMDADVTGETQAPETPGE